MIKEELFNDIKGFVQRSFQKNKSAMLEYKLGLPGRRSNMDAELQGWESGISLHYSRTEIKKNQPKTLQPTSTSAGHQQWDFHQILKDLICCPLASAWF